MISLEVELDLASVCFCRER